MDEYQARELGNAYDILCDLTEKVDGGYATEDEKRRHDNALIIVQEANQIRNSYGVSKRTNGTGPIMLFFIWSIVTVGTVATITIAAHFLKLAVIAFGNAAMLH